MRTKEKIVECAKRLFNRDGYKNTSLKKIIDESGVQKGGIYYYFPNKETLAFDVIKQAGDDLVKFLNKSSHGKTAFEKIVNQLSAILDYHKQKQCKLGCIFGNSALEMSNHSELIRQAINDLFKRWGKLLQNLLEEASSEGSLKNELESKSEELSMTIVAMIEGGIMLSKTGRDCKHLKNVINSIISFICK